jgi:hypothetical protein
MFKLAVGTALVLAFAPRIGSGIAYTHNAITACRSADSFNECADWLSGDPTTRLQLQFRREDMQIERGTNK